MWGDEEPDHLPEVLGLSDAELAKQYPALYEKKHNYLVLSGGDPMGAFGAGFMTGWMEREDTPEFAVVTGISAGGLIAPFVFLGEDYKDSLREVFTEYSTREILDFRSVDALWQDSVADNSKFRKAIQTYVTDQFLTDLVREHRKGRILLVGTTNFDSGRPVYWNLGKIAEKGGSEARRLITDLFLATSAIPGLFPPVRIEVTVNGQMYDEMHVDGGIISNVFLFPSGLYWNQLTERFKAGAEPALYLVQNFHMTPQYEAVEPRIPAILLRSTLVRTRTQMVGDVYKVFATAQRDGIDFNMTAIPATFTQEPEEFFDLKYTRNLYDFGYVLGLQGPSWSKYPPEYAVPEDSTKGE